MNADSIRAFTPIVLAGIGGILGLFSLIKTPENPTAGLGLAGTAIAGASGLANGSKDEPKEDRRIETNITTKKV
jgi:hypothetical protein